MYITNLEDDLQKNGMEKKAKRIKCLQRKLGLLKALVVNLGHVSELYEESGSEDDKQQFNKVTNRGGQLVLAKLIRLSSTS